MIKQSIMPWARWVAGRLRYKFAQLKANFPLNRQPQQAQTVFIIGCGRSETTVLGEVLEQHPQTYYFFEPWHLWAAVDSHLDTTNLYTTNGFNPTIGTDSFSKEAQARFNCLFYHSLGLGNKILIEKTPHSAWRIDYLKQLVPNARFVHIVRDGIDVADFINKSALENSYRITPASQLNPWWGFNDSKWGGDNKKLRSCWI